MGETSFNDVLQNILKPAGITVGGYPEDIFLNLSEEENDKWQCNICYLVVRDAKECINCHLFCRSCIFAWSMTGSANCEKCPVCRADGNAYGENHHIDTLIGEQKVQCKEAMCAYKGQLKYFIQYHHHGKSKYNSVEANWDEARNLQRERARQQRHVGFPFPMFAPNQLVLGRIMLQHMMAEFQLELERRRQAIRDAERRGEVSIQERQREVVNLSNQLEEIETMLTMLTISVNPFHSLFAFEVPSHATLGAARFANPMPRRAEIVANITTRANERQDPVRVSPENSPESSAEAESEEESPNVGTNGRFSGFFRRDPERPSTVRTLENSESEAAARRNNPATSHDTHNDFRRTTLPSIASTQGQTIQQEDQNTTVPALGANGGGSTPRPEESERPAAARPRGDNHSGSLVPNSTARRRSSARLRSISDNTTVPPPSRPVIRNRTTSIDSVLSANTSQNAASRRDVSSSQQRRLNLTRNPRGQVGRGVAGQPGTRSTQAPTGRTHRTGSLPTTPGALLRSRRRSQQSDSENNIP